MARTYRGMLVPGDIPRGEILEVTLTKDMDGISREAFLVEFFERNKLRRAYFSTETGEYLGDTFVPPCKFRLNYIGPL